MRALVLFALVLGACATSHRNPNGGGIDSSTDPVDSPMETIDSPQGTIDSPPGTIDSPQATIDSPPGMIDAPPMIDASVDAKPVDASVDAQVCSTQPCSLAPQCGCPLNQSCDIDPSNSAKTACRAVTSPGHDTNTCTGNDCDVGYGCIGDGSHDACKKYCSSNADCASPRGQCVIQLVDSSQKEIPGAVVCSSNCDPTASAAAYCPSGWKCSMFTATYKSTDYDISDCEVAGGGVQGTSCTVSGSNPPNGDDTKCAANYLCTTADQLSFQCRKICNYTSGGANAPECTAIGKKCYSVGGKIANVQYGVCN